MKDNIKEAIEIYDNALTFFDYCDPDYFEEANAYLTYAMIRLNEEIRNTKENKHD